MEHLSAARWRQHSAWLDELEPLSLPERAARLHEIGTMDAAAATELRSLLDSADVLRESGFLNGSADLHATMPRLQPGVRLGPWALIEPVGHGGMGEVWRARRADGRYEGQAAIKLLKFGMQGSRSQERFHREGALLARLRHPGIAQLLDAGVTPDGLPYLVLEWVQGERIDQWCTERHLSLARRVALFIALLNAVSAAHGQLAIHRDLKPSNILVDSHGAVKLLDFGIARLLDEDAQAQLTREGLFALTPAYAAPEQFEGGVLGVATDVYALGVVLFELLTGVHPSGLSPGSPPLDYLRAATTGTRRPASAVAASPADAKALAGDLDNILAHAMAADPTQRYASVQALADDLDAHLHHRPIVARRASLPKRARKFVRRNRLAVALAGAAALALLIGLIGTAGMAMRAERSANLARAERDLAVEEMTKARRLAELNSFIGMSMPAGQALTPQNVLARSVDFIERREGMAPGHRALLLSVVGDQLSSLGEFRSAQDALERAKGHAAQSPDPGVRADVACNLAAVLAAVQSFDAARREYLAGLASLPDEPRYLPARINCLQQGESAEREAGNTLDSIALAEQAVQLNERLSAPNPRGHIDSLGHLAMAYQMGGRLAQAQATYEETERLAAQLHLGQTAIASILYVNWSSLQVYAGRPLVGLALSRKSRQLQNAGNPDAADATVAVAFDELALRQLGEPAQALSYSDRLVRFLETSGHRVAGNIALINRVAIVRELGQLDAAEELIAQAEQRIAPMPRNNYHFGVLRLEQGLISAERGQAGRAKQQIDEAVALLRASSNAALYLPLALLRRAEFQVAQGQVDAARGNALEAQGLLAASLGPGAPSLHLGDAWQVLGQAAAMREQPQAARNAFAAAAREYDASLGETHAKSQRAHRLAAR